MTLTGLLGGIPPSLAAELVKEGKLEAFPLQPLEIDRAMVQKDDGGISLS